MINRCVVFLLAFVFFLQQLSAFTVLKTAGGTAKTNFSAEQRTNSLTNTQLSVHLPYQSSPVGFEMEVEVAEEDDTKNDLEEFCSNLAAIHAIEEQVYTSYLRSRYLQIASSVHDQPAIPFFILYHSWKNHLA
ncbi:hypothetical protein ESA94_17405 [Lacibacter luteus]|uniref:Uncharacterized protein n=1 Tax=Lacibacter luteus TaxID=2508719 RepID=A0A4Q1CEW1_9BACT|nr:hypothetical protein [Lacibacter luteus]RXK58416.1 hypothetical protein ESA94_17405 [Lacibacter luteus]